VLRPGPYRGGGTYTALPHTLQLVLGEGKGRKNEKRREHGMGSEKGTRETEREEEGQRSSESRTKFGNKSTPVPSNPNENMSHME